jgi:hypothetical protein
MILFDSHETRLTISPRNGVYLLVDPISKRRWKWTDVATQQESFCQCYGAPSMKVGLPPRGPRRMSQGRIMALCLSLVALAGEY